jgi:hypothetical protein
MVGLGCLSARHGANIRVTMGFCTCFLALKVHQRGAPAEDRLVTFVITTRTDPSGINAPL